MGCIPEKMRDCVRAPRPSDHSVRAGGPACRVAPGGSGTGRDRSGGLVVERRRDRRGRARRRRAPPVAARAAAAPVRGRGAGVLTGRTGSSSSSSASRTIRRGSYRRGSSAAQSTSPTSSPSSASTRSLVSRMNRAAARTHPELLGVAGQPLGADDQGGDEQQDEQLAAVDPEHRVRLPPAEPAGAHGRAPQRLGRRRLVELHPHVTLAGPLRTCSTTVSPGVRARIATISSSGSVTGRPSIARMTSPGRIPARRPDRRP